MTGRPWEPKPEHQPLIDAINDAEQEALKLDAQAAQIRRTALTAAIDGGVSLKWLAENVFHAARKTVYRRAGMPMK